MDSRIIYLLLKYINDECTSEELEEVMLILKDGSYAAEWEVALNEDAAAFLEDIRESDLSQQEINSLYACIERDLQAVPAEQPVIGGPKRIVPLWLRMVAAASVILGVAISGYFLLQKQPAQQVAQRQDIAPGHNQATLTLAGGRKIIITKNLRGALATQGHTLIKAGDAISYTAAKGGETKVEYNTLTTAKGEQSPAPLSLADGTRVWLNAASSITFPTAFPGKERVVTVTGEATFVVAHNAAQPFKIRVADQIVQDIGTEFNINAYTDEPAVKVTLAAGKVKIIKGGNEAFLNPGQEAVTTADHAGIVVKNADLDVAFAWRNGLFLYDNEPLESIMRKVARWYDVDVVYEGANKNKLFGGGISRYKNVSQVLRKLELTGGVHFTIEGRRIIARK